jgi:[ribosomal protein S5]-alanine N-acetyltransferase
VFDVVIETERLILRPYRQDDLDDLAPMFADPEHMRWYPAPFTREQSQAWIDKQFERYERDGFGLFVVELLDGGGFAGTVGPTMQQVDGEPRVEIGWHIRPALKGRGLAVEAGDAARAWAFANLDVDHVISLIRPENTASCRVAGKLGMTIERETDHANMKHYVYRSDRPDI